jgi:predicted double-glycine peptidase
MTPPWLDRYCYSTKFLGASLFSWSVLKIASFVLMATCLSFGTPTYASGEAPPVKSILERRHENVVLQNYELSCAAAALATILRYQYGFPATEHSVSLGLINRQEYLANPSLVRLRQGFSFLDMKRFVDKLGFEGVGLGQLAFSDLLEHAPMIVPVNILGYPHFVVFRGATESRVLLADPAFGNLTMTVDKFISGWIKYRDIGRVGFVVKKDGNLASPGRLLATPSEFVFLK